MDVPNDAPICAVCRSPLNITDIEGVRTVRHPPGVSLDHEPVPVSGEADPAKMSCDFCSSTEPLYLYPATSHDARTKMPSGRTLVEIGDKGWTACARCAELVDRRDLKALVRRVMSLSPTVKAMSEGLPTAQATAIHRQLRDTLRERYQDFMTSRSGPKVELH